MKNILIIIGDMRIGGAQRSLLSFLKCLMASEQAKSYRVSLMVVDPAGDFYGDIPAGITLIEPPKALRWLGTAFSKKLLREHFSVKCLMGQIHWILQKKLGRLPAQWNTQQKLWHCWKKRIPALPGHYDTAISYIDGFPNYYIMDKVSADKKVLWVHNEYQKLGYDRDYDRGFYQQAQGIITISQRCKDCIAQAFPELENQVHILENITVSEEVLEKSQRDKCPEFEGFSGLKLLSVGRLNSQKGYDIAIETASILKAEGIPFLWLVLGEGPERSALEAQISQMHMEKEFVLLGSRSNPYSYMAKSDILVQTSRFEGKSMAVDEARILCKPVVVTNYTTAADSVEQGKTGWITDMTPKAVAEELMMLYREPEKRRKCEKYLQTLEQGNEKELQKYLEIMF